MARAQHTRTYLRVASALLLSLVLLFPHLLGQLGSLRLFALAVGFASLALEILLLGVPLKTRLTAVGAIGAYLAIAIGSIELLAAQLDDRLFAVNAEHLFALLPLFAALGWAIYKSGHGRTYLLVLLGAATLVSGLAIAESLLDRSLMGRDYEFVTTQREGLTRALVGSENALVLGVTLAAFVPLTLKLRRLRYQLAVGLILVLGVWATGSRAPALICTAIAALQYVPILRSLLQRYLWIAYAIAGAAVAALAYLTIFVWTPYIAGATGLQYSSNYRGALYAMVPELLRERPFGYLLQTSPAGRWMVDSELHGQFDIARSIDSEIVFAIFGLGWIGLGLFLVAACVSIATIKHDVAIGLSALTITALGFSLALHGWDSMSLLWYALLGIGTGVTLLPRIRRLLSSRHSASALV